MEQFIKLSNYRNASIDDFYFDFEKIWKRDFKERSIFDLWLHIVDHASRIAKAVKRENPPAIIDDIADTTVWLMSFVSFLGNQPAGSDLISYSGITPSKIIWNKYPGICPACFDSIIIDKFRLADSKDPHLDITNLHNKITLFLDAEKDSLYLKKCDCLTRNQMKKNDIRAAVKSDLVNLRNSYADILTDAKMMRGSILEIEHMFEEIYESYYKIYTLEFIMFNLLSEIGETSQAIVNLYTYDESREPFSSVLAEKRKYRLLEKIADIFSWLFAASIKIRNTYGKISQSYYETITKSQHFSQNIQTLSFADIIWSKYGMSPNGGNWDKLKCPGCQCAPCECPRDLKINWNATYVDFIDDKVPDMPEPNNINLTFISYSHKDENWLIELKRMLKPAVKNDKLSLWDDTRIQPGKSWQEEIVSALSRSKIAILIVTPNFLESDFIMENELPPLLLAAEDGGTKIGWIPFSSSMYTETELKKYQALWPTDKPLDKMSEAERNEALVTICQKIQKLAGK